MKSRQTLKAEQAKSPLKHILAVMPNLPVKALVLRNHCLFHPLQLMSLQGWHAHTNFVRSDLTLVVSWRPLLWVMALAVKKDTNISNLAFIFFLNEQAKHLSWNFSLGKKWSKCSLQGPFLGSHLDNCACSFIHSFIWSLNCHVHTQWHNPSKLHVYASKCILGYYTAYNVSLNI